tara:strand:+ start:154 stop:390 length:237 start_codon:yes stop_codon:yes gene_type:complete
MKEKHLEKDITYGEALQYFYNYIKRYSSVSSDSYEYSLMKLLDRLSADLRDKDKFGNSIFDEKFYADQAFNKKLDKEL